MEEFVAFLGLVGMLIGGGYVYKDMTTPDIRSYFNKP
jgi:hypothetical protein